MVEAEQVRQPGAARRAMREGNGAAVGFVGLGHMGGALAANLVDRDRKVLVHDIAGPERTPTGASFVSLPAMAVGVETIVLSLPDGEASLAVARELVGVADCVVQTVVDTSTIGVGAAREMDALLGEAGIGYVDAPVSGGVAGARARTLMLMVAADDDRCARVDLVLDDLSDRRRRVGGRPGMGQAVKLANNFLCANAFAAVTEAVLFGAAAGVPPATLLEVVNESSGQSAVSRDRFPDHVLTERYAAGFTNTLMHKDLRLFQQGVCDQHGPRAVADVVAAIWATFAEAEPGADFTRIFPFVENW